MSDAAVAIILGAVWLTCSVLGGGALALLARRIHPSLSVRRLWIFYSFLLGFTVAVVLVIAWF